MKKEYLLIIMVLALVLSACGSTSTPTPIPTLVLDGINTDNSPKPVSSGGSVVASAVVVPAQEAYLAFINGGNVAMVNVTIGERVKAGDVLVELDNTLLQLDFERAQRTLRELTSPASIAAAEQAVANAQESHDDAKKKVDSLGRRFVDSVTKDYLEAQLVLAQDALDYARDAYNRTGKLSDADPARAKAATDLYNAQKAYNTALGNLNWYTELPSENEIALTNADFNFASAALQEATWYLAAIKGEMIPADASGAKLAQLQQAKADVTAAQNRLEQSFLTAPFSGVIADVDVIAGEFATPGKILIVISDMDHLQIKTTDLSERDIIDVKIEDPAVIMVDALNEDFNGRVIAISPTANTLGGDVVYEVTIEFDEQPAGVLGGMSVEVSIGE